MSNNAPRFMKCDACRDVKKSLIATMNQGYLCDDCYYSKNPSFSFFNRRWEKNMIQMIKCVWISYIIWMIEWLNF